MDYHLLKNDHYSYSMVFVNGTVVILLLEHYERCIRYPVLYCYLVFGRKYCITVP